MMKAWELLGFISPIRVAKNLFELLFTVEIKSERQANPARIASHARKLVRILEVYSDSIDREGLRLQENLENLKDEVQLDKDNSSVLRKIMRVQEAIRSNKRAGQTNHASIMTYERLGNLAKELNLRLVAQPDQAAIDAFVAHAQQTMDETSISPIDSLDDELEELDDSYSMKSLEMSILRERGLIAEKKKQPGNDGGSREPIESQLEKIKDTPEDTPGVEESDEEFSDRQLELE